VKDSAAEIVLFSVLPVAWNDKGRNRRSHQINTWLQAWCHQRDVGFFDHGLVYMTPDLLDTDRVQRGGERSFV